MEITMKQKIIKFIKEFLQIDELENQLTQIDNELQDNVSELDGMRMDVEDRPTHYDMESYTDSQVEDNYNLLQDKIDNLETKLEELEGKIEN
jgi:predicted nuclease with TOPRIM domain